MQADTPSGRVGCFPNGPEQTAESETGPRHQYVYGRLSNCAAGKTALVASDHKQQVITSVRKAPTIISPSRIRAKDFQAKGCPATTLKNRSCRVVSKGLRAAGRAQTLQGKRPIPARFL
jgi:hypothetical protein